MATYGTRVVSIICQNISESKCHTATGNRTQVSRLVTEYANHYTTAGANKFAVLVHFIEIISKKLSSNKAILFLNTQDQRPKSESRNSVKFSKAKISTREFSILLFSEFCLRLLFAVFDKTNWHLLGLKTTFLKVSEKLLKRKKCNKEKSTNSFFFVMKS